MITLKVHHRTSYSYRTAVAFDAHRLILRPRESRELHLLTSHITTAPVAKLSWAYDVFSNAVATATFLEQSDTLTIDHESILQLDAAPAPLFDVADYARTYPFTYSDDDEWADLGALTNLQYPDPDGALNAWALGFAHNHPIDTIALLKGVSAGIAEQIAYRVRDEEGTQTPTETLRKKTGSCRDFAVLFVEAMRALRFGARLVSGYLYSAVQDNGPGPGSMSTHAWAEVYVPGAGWVTFDPTNRSVGNFNLIPVAVARNIGQIMPVSGRFTGATDSYAGMTVEVSVHRV